MEEWRAFVTKNKELGQITETDSPYAAPVFFIHKKDGSFRLVQDYCEINKHTMRNVTTFPPFCLPNPVHVLCFMNHITFPFTITLLFIITCRRGSPLILISDFDSLCLPSYLRYFIRCVDPLWQALPRPFLYLTLASTMTKP